MRFYARRWPERAATDLRRWPTSYAFAVVVSIWQCSLCGGDTCALGGRVDSTGCAAKPWPTRAAEASLKHRNIQPPTHTHTPHTPHTPCPHNPTPTHSGASGGAGPPPPAASRLMRLLAVHRQMRQALWPLSLHRAGDQRLDNASSADHALCCKCANRPCLAWLHGSGAGEHENEASAAQHRKHSATHS